MPFHSFRLLDAGVGSHVVGHPDVAADNGVVADSDTTQDAGIAVDGDIVLNDGMAGDVEHVAVGVFLEALRTQRHTLIKSYVTADDTGLTDNNACTMINGKVFANLRTGMDVDARF